MTCDKLVLLWILNRQAKLFLRSAYWIMKISWKHHTGGWSKNILKKPYKVKRERNFFLKRKKFSQKYTTSILFIITQIASSICFLGFYEDKNTKLHNMFFCGANHSGESHGSTSSTNNVSFQLGQNWSCLKYVLNILYQVFLLYLLY